jgi:hypothetical protein
MWGYHQLPDSGLGATVLKFAAAGFLGLTVVALGAAVGLGRGLAVLVTFGCLGASVS